MASATDQETLLAELTIDRSDRHPTGSGRRKLYLAMLAPLVPVGFVYLLITGPVGADFMATPTEEQPQPAVVVPAKQSGPEPAAEPGTASVLDATGYVVARRQTAVGASVSGKVAEVLVEEGMAVTAGQLLARLDDRIPAAELRLVKAELAAAQASGEEVAAEIVRAEADLRRWRPLAARQMASHAQLDAIEAELETLRARQRHAAKRAGVVAQQYRLAELRLDEYQIRAPFAGVIVRRFAQPGEMLSPFAGGGLAQTGLLTIVDMDSLEVEVDVSEGYINRVSPGQQTRVRLNAHPDINLGGMVLAVIPAADRGKGTVRVRIGLDDIDSRALPDMGVRVAFFADRGADR